jgi:hypothetical protein
MGKYDKTCDIYRRINSGSMILSAPEYRVLIGRNIYRRAEYF